MSRVSIPTLIIALLVVFILLAFACTHEVAFYQAAVKVRFGKPLAIITTPGLKARWPWPIESIEEYDTRLRTLDSAETEVKTADGKNVILGTYVVWKIQDPLKFYTSVRSIPRAEEQMRTRISQAQAAVVGQKTLPDFVNLDRQALETSYTGILDEMRGRVAPSVATDYGIQINEIGVRRISLPKEVTREVFKSMIQDRKRLATKYREEGKSRAEAIKARAEADAKQILAFADYKASQIRSAGTQATTRILEKINASDREFFEWLRWIEALKAALRQKTTIFIDQNWPFFNPFVNPPLPAETKP
jgi:modulator of FtsH protease HflC